MAFRKFYFSLFYRAITNIRSIIKKERISLVEEKFSQQNETQSENLVKMLFLIYWRDLFASPEPEDSHSVFKKLYISFLWEVTYSNVSGIFQEDMIWLILYFIYRSVLRKQKVQVLFYYGLKHVNVRKEGPWWGMDECGNTFQVFFCNGNFVSLLLNSFHYLSNLLVPQTQKKSLWENQMHPAINKRYILKIPSSGLRNNSSSPAGFMIFKKQKQKNNAMGTHISRSGNMSYALKKCTPTTDSWLEQATTKQNALAHVPWSHDMLYRP